MSYDPNSYDWKAFNEGNDLHGYIPNYWNGGITDADGNSYAGRSSSMGSGSTARRRRVEPWERVTKDQLIANISEMTTLLNQLSTLKTQLQKETRGLVIGTDVTDSCFNRHMRRGIFSRSAKPGEKISLGETRKFFKRMQADLKGTLRERKSWLRKKVGFAMYHFFEKKKLPPINT